jgi:hypothetical protein
MPTAAASVARNAPAYVTVVALAVAAGVLWTSSATAWTYEAVYDIDPGAHAVTAHLAGSLTEAITCTGVWVETGFSSTATASASRQVRYHGAPAALRFGWVIQNGSYVNETNLVCTAGAHGAIAPQDRYPGDGSPWSEGECRGVPREAAFANVDYYFCAPHTQMRGQARWGTPLNHSAVPFTGKINVYLQRITDGLCVDNVLTPGIVYGQPAILPPGGDTCPLYATGGSYVYAQGTASNPLPTRVSVGHEEAPPMGTWQWWTQVAD